MYGTEEEPPYDSLIQQRRSELTTGSHEPLVSSEVGNSEISPGVGVSEFAETNEIFSTGEFCDSDKFSPTISHSAYSGRLSLFQAQMEKRIDFLGRTLTVTTTWSGALGRGSLRYRSGETVENSAPRSLVLV